MNRIHVRVSFETSEYTGNVTGLGTSRLLEAIRRSNPDFRFYLASSSEMLGHITPLQNEESCFWPRSPYACAKVYSYWMARNYWDRYGMFPAMESCLITNPPDGEKYLSPEKLPGGL